jgi:hypothetical protein
VKRRGKPVVLPKILQQVADKYEIDPRLFKEAWTRLRAKLEKIDDPWSTTDKEFAQNLLAGEETMLLDYGASAGFINIETMKKPNIVYPNKKTVSLPEKFTPSNIDYLHDHYPQECINMCVDASCYSPEYLSTVLNIFYRAGYKDVRLTWDTKKEVPLRVEAGKYRIYIGPRAEEPDTPPRARCSLDETISLGKLPSTEARIYWRTRQLAQELAVPPLFFHNVLKSFGYLTKNELLSTDDVTENLEERGVIIDTSHVESYTPPKYAEKAKEWATHQRYSKRVTLPGDIDTRKLVASKLNQKSMEKKRGQTKEDPSLDLVQFPNGAIYWFEVFADVLKAITTLPTKPEIQFWVHPKEQSFPVKITANGHMFLIAPRIEDEDEEIPLRTGKTVIQLADFLRYGMGK